MSNDAHPLISDTNQYSAPLPVQISRDSLSQQELRNENGRLRQELASFKQQVAALELSMRQQQNITGYQPSVYQPQKEKNTIMAASLTSPKNKNSYKHKISPEVEKDIMAMETGTKFESSQGLHHRSRLMHATGQEYSTMHTPTRVGPQLELETDGIHREPTPGLEEEDFVQSVTDRAGWLVGLLVMQSMSSFIIARNESLLQRHGVIIQFLTMLVGAGGNAGNQASVRVIRGLAVGSIDDTNTKPFLKRELLMGLCLSIILGVAGFCRALLFFTPWPETFAITISLFIIVACSVIIGALLPFAMRSVGIDPAHSRYVATIHHWLALGLATPLRHL
jgi:cation transporter-like permease